MIRSEVQVHDLGVHGEGVARHAGLVLFVPGALPGDRCLVEWESGRRQMAQARLLEIVEPSLARVSPACPAFGACGGCDLQHLELQAQLQAKSRRVEQALLRIGGIAAHVAPCLPSPETFGYRAKISWPVRDVGGAARIGLYARQSHVVVEEDGCAVAHPALRALPAAVRRLCGEIGVAPYAEATGEGSLRHVVARRSRSSGEILVTLVTARADERLRDLAQALRAQDRVIAGVALNQNAGRGNAVFGRQTQMLDGMGEIVERILGLDLRIGPTSFFQVNPAAAEVLFRSALECAGERAGAGPVLDLYTGTGVLALLFARQGALVTGIELSAEAIAFARRNAAANGLAARFETGDAGRWPIGAERLVILDPPRQGAEAVCRRLAAAPAAGVLYVSCDPATLARDARILADGGYRLAHAQPVDLFPQTMHVETVALFLR